MQKTVNNQSNAHSFSKPFIKLKNLLKNTDVYDTLHHKAVVPTECAGNRCLASKYYPPFERPPMVVRPTKEVLCQAGQFLDEYYTSIGKANSVEYQERLKDIIESVTKTGTYDMTLEEIEFGAKTAWRNTPRCLGRIHWQTLKIFDARHVKTSKEMFEHICEMMRYANNNGNIRAAMTIFPHRTDGLHDFRVWNGQIIKYAGYAMPDGSFIGDPFSVEFTEFCEKLGWKGKGGHFDILPVVLSANGEDPEMFELPEELILDVNLEHPVYPWFAEMKLKWYVVAAISNMLFDCGGLEFTAAPFTGWLMDTEIGTRNLCDPNRYNILPLVAEKLNLDMRKAATQWKDKAAIEVNLAVIHSFHKAKMTMTDHHTATEAFQQHWETEYRVRGGCPADWVWMVPPTGGSLTPVFHQEMLNYHLKPSIEYQPNLLTTHIWKNPENIKRFSKKKHSEINFSILVKVAFFAALIYRKILEKRIPCTVLYASETGTAQRFAEQLARNFRLVFNTKLVCMDSYKIENLLSEKLVLVVTSTFGSGQSPENGRTFASRLSKLASSNQDRQKQTPTEIALPNNMKNIRYSVFGLGNSSYEEFCGFGHFMNKHLANIGAKSLYPIGEGDELGGQKESFDLWSAEVLKAACDEFGLKQVTAAYESQEPQWTPDKFRSAVAYVSEKKNIYQNLASIHHKAIFPCKINKRKHLLPTDYSRQTMLASLSPEGHENMTYLPGDHVGIYPVNDTQEVNNILDYVHMIPGFDEEVEIQVKEGNKWKPYNRLPACSLRTGLTYFLDIKTPPSKVFLQRLAQYAQSPEEEAALEKLSKNTDEYEDWKRTSLPTLLHVLSQFPSVRGLPTSFLLSQLPLLQQRFYSISSSQQAHPDEIHVTYAVVQYVTPKNHSDIRKGICTTWLRDCDETMTVPCFIKSAPSFHLPADPSVPVIMVATGTGLAPFRGFWQQRRLDLEKMDMTKETTPSRKVPKKNYIFSLYFGCRNDDIDNIFKEELQEALTDSVLSHLNVALSRQTGMKKTYVQHLLLRDSEFIYSVLTAQKGHIYICGDSNMAADVRNTLEKIYVQCKDADNKESSQFVQQLQSSGQLHEDIFGVKLLLPQSAS